MLKRRDGFTLIELLIAGSISLLILALIFQGVRGGSSSTQIIQGQYQIVEELRNAGNFMSDTLAQAAYIYPPGTTITLGSPDLYTVTKPSSGNSWTVGTDPIIAFLLPPVENSTLACNASNPSRCLRFVAFYALQRSSVVANAPVNANPGADNNDANTWVLAMYSCTIHGGSGGACGGNAQKYVPDTVPNTFSGASGQLLTDYISPTLWSLGASSYLCVKNSSGEVVMNAGCVSSGSLDKNRSASRVNLTLGASIIRQGKTISTGPMSLQMAGRNLNF